MPVTLVMLGITHFVCGLYQGSRLTEFFYRVVICLVVPNVMLLAVYCRSKEFEFLIAKGRRLWENRKHS